MSPQQRNTSPSFLKLSERHQQAVKKIIETIVEQLFSGRARGFSRLPEGWSYRSARARCNPNNPTHKNYKNWAGRGIRFEFSSFTEFIHCLGGWKPSSEMSLDRINNDDHYRIGNIRWATHREQILNRRKKQRNEEKPNEKGG